MFDGSEGRMADPAWAWLPYEVDDKRPWNAKMAGHLYRRAAFGATWSELQEAIQHRPGRTVDRLLHADDAQQFNATIDQFDSEATASDSPSVEALRHWWLRRMIQTPFPLLEKMCLFWHDYFGIGNERVQNGRLMRQYVHLLRGHALGSFSAMLTAVMQESALVASADFGNESPSPLGENLARRLLDDYTVGPGAYSPTDLKETARAFSGWVVSKGQPRYLSQRHDEGEKTIFQESGAWKGEDAVRIALGRRQTAMRVVQRLYRWLVSEAETPSEELLAPLVESFAKDWNIARLVESMLRSNWFFSPASYRQRIKSPVEYAMSIVRPFKAVIPTSPLDLALIAMGQNLCQPPTVQGWPGGKGWINAYTLAARANLAAALLCGQEPYGDKLRPSELFERQSPGKDLAAREFFLELFLQADVDASALAVAPIVTPDAADAALRSLAHQVVTLPEFHLA